MRPDDAVALGAGEADVAGARHQMRCPTRRGPRSGSRRGRRTGWRAGRRRPSTRYVAPTLSDPVAIRLDASATTLTGVPPSRSRTTVTSPPAVRRGFAARRPVVATSRPSRDSPSGIRPDRDGRRDRTAPASVDVARHRPDLELAVRRRELAGRPRAIAPRPNAPAPAGRRTTSPAVASPIASSAGVPRRPASAMTTPVAVTREPRGSARTTASVGRVALGDGVAAGVGVGTGVGVAVGAGVGVGPGVGDGVGPGVGVAVGSAWASSRGSASASGSSARARRRASRGPGSRRARPGAVALARAGRQRPRASRPRRCARRGHPGR